MATQAIHNLTDTWNDVGTTFTGIKMNVTATASAAGSLLLDLQVGGASKGQLTKDGVFNALEFGLGAAASSADVFLKRDAANTLAQRNGTNAQVSRVYNTYTDAANNEFGGFRWTGNRLEVGTDKTGTGTHRVLRLLTRGSAELQFGTSDTLWLRMTAAGHLIWQTDNTNDIGASGATRPRTIYVGTSIILPATSAALQVGTHSANADAPITGFITIKDAAGTDRKIAVIA